jgi:hypothetical protein
LPTTKLVPTSPTGGGAVVSWSISQALPTGLSFSTTDGTISGTPTVAAAAATYTISATNSGGQSTFALTLSVQSGTLLDLGHSDSIQVLRFDGTHVLSADVAGHWVLWNYATGTSIARGDAGCVDASLSGDCKTLSVAGLVGSTLVIQTTAAFEIRSPMDGHVIATIPTPGVAIFWWKLASDGSYLVAGSSAGLLVWSATGQQLFSKPDTTGYGPLFAAPGALRVPKTAGPVNVVETISLPSGVVTDSPPFQGSFLTWFADGSRFLTGIANSLLTYSSAGALEDTTPVTGQSISFVGSGNWFGVQDVSGKLSIYKVGASTSPAATFQISPLIAVTVAGTNFLARPDPGNGFAASAQVSVIDLSGATPVRVDQPTPVARGTAYAATSVTQWLIGNQYGVIFDGASAVANPRYLDYGAAWSIAGSGTRFAISTASGRVLHFDAGTKTLEGTIQDFSDRVLLSADGTVLAALGDLQGRGGVPSDLKTKVYSLPGGGVISTWPSNGTDPTPAHISLSASGAVLGQIFGAAAQTNPVTGGPATWTNSGGPQCAALRLSPDGTHIACAGADGPPDFYQPASASNSTAVYNIGVAGAVNLSGVAAGWLDDGHLLLNNFKAAGAGPLGMFTGGTIYGPTGTLLGISPLPYLQDFQSLTPDTLYSSKLNSILSATTGGVTWMSGVSSRGIGAVAGANVVFASGAQVLALPR